MMGVRAVNSCSIFRSASSPPISAVRCPFFTFRSSSLSRHPKLGFLFPVLRPEKKFFGHGSVWSCSVHSLVDIVMEELEFMRKRKRVCAASKVGLTSSGKLLEDKLVNRAMEKGLLLEFKKDSDRVLLAVAQRPDGKKNWMVYDQNGATSSIKPQQITYIVPGIENFDHAGLSNFIRKAQDNLDPALLEFAWVELLEKNKSVTTEELAEMIFGSAEPLESYCAHLLLSKDELYFSVLETKGSRSLYGPRPTVQVEELLQRKLAREAAEKELQEIVQLLKAAKAMPLEAKPPKSSWIVEDKIRHIIESLESYAIDACKNDEQKKTAGMILKAMGLTKTASSAVNLLIDIGYFPVHVNLELLKFNIRTDHSDEIISAAESLLVESSDPDELDDALSAARLQDGRLKVWIHVADSSRFVQPGSLVDREAMRRGTSIFLPTATYPMFPEKLAMEGMSLKQGEICNAVSVSVVLRSDGSIAEYSVDNSFIKPTYMLTYESASELLHMNLEEEVELKILSEAAALRLQWRLEQGAVDTGSLEARIKVANPEDPEPIINLYVENQADPAMRMVSEMMILCGEVIATYGSCNNIPLPYRGQPQSNIDISAFAHLPEGPIRSSAIVKVMRAAEIDFRKPIRHGILGLPGYVQFTSPIRRYMDLLAHYQVKAYLRGDSLPFSAGQLEGMASIINMHTRLAKRLFGSSLRYWILEYLRRQAKERRYRALILRFIKDRIAALLLVEVGFQASASVSVGLHIGDEIEVWVEESHPRDDYLALKEVI
ncbi:ribonuclease II, chloroplastic/mitochondrial isoform X2 [Juglans microcarpa x Juglans regia]|uniref:ribonuclease II, chloroplastic/mitochondrial isoform X2 n=1 Tax=Juglans microcarpa x Juglans regia TaxID=2249226 RepID=UPI001B7E5A0A|nr:ribonuclease II, chloroplastic/mitochondrial isoform X2 [Juglans microcarpa x Juglans regia]